MILLLISDPDKIEGENELVNKLFECGLDFYHLRKPNYSKDEMEAFLKQINPKFIRKTLLHSHHDLVKKYNIGGFHFPSAFLQNENNLKELIHEAKKRKLRTGTSAHSLQEAANLRGFDYYFLSPVFDSISKEGYKSSFDFKELKSFLKNSASEKNHPEAIALGGIDEDNIDVVKDMKFKGVALLGSIWKDFHKENLNLVLGKFNKIQQLVKYE